MPKTKFGMFVAPTNLKCKNSNQILKLGLSKIGSELMIYLNL